MIYGTIHFYGFHMLNETIKSNQKEIQKFEFVCFFSYVICLSTIQ